MVSYFGFVLLFAIVGGGFYLYYHVARLDREIESQRRSVGMNDERA